jgi:hypothetical protein
MSVGEAQDLELLARDFARAADGEAGLRERVTADKDIGQAELAAERRHLVLEQFAQQLDQRRRIFLKWYLIKSRLIRNCPLV